MYCYNCGAEVGNSKYCNNCGTDTQPPRDVYFVEEDCGDCNTPLPRWARACPKCGKIFGFTEPTDKKLVAKRNRGLATAAIVFSIFLIFIATILSLGEDAIPFKYAMIGAAILIAVIWLSTIIRWERGKTKDGTVIRHFSEERTRSEKDINSPPTITGRTAKRNFKFTLYSTEVQFDDGSKEIFNLENPADHIQLPIGSRVRYYLSTQSYRRI